MPQFIFTCPTCKQRFAATDEMIGTMASCSECGETFVVQKQMPPLAKTRCQHDIPMLVLGILACTLWWIPIFSLPIPIVGFIMSYHRNYQLGVILNCVGLALSVFWTLICAVD